jgi:hypothetical protein
VPRAFAILSGRDDRRGPLRPLDGALGFELQPFGGDAVRHTRAAETVTDPERAFLGAIEAIAGGDWRRRWPAGVRRNSGRASRARGWFYCYKSGRHASSGRCARTADR